MMKLVYDHNPIPLSASEVERITGADRRTLVRLRNRGLLAKSGPRTQSYTAPEAVEIHVFTSLEKLLPFTVRWQDLVEHAKEVTPNVLWHILYRFKPWRFSGSPVQRLRFEAEVEQTEYYDFCRKIAGARPGSELHTFYAWSGGGLTPVSDLQNDFNSNRRPVRILIDNECLANEFGDRLTTLLYEITPKIKKGRG